MKLAILSNGPGNYSTKRLVEEAKKRGHDVQVVKYKNCYLALDDRNPDVYYNGEKLPRFDAILPRISNNMTRYGCAVVRQFEMQGVWTSAPSVAITRARDKLRAAQILAKYDVETPKTVVSRNTSDIDDLIEQIGLPVIIKLATGTHGNGVILADTKKAAKSALQAFYLYNEDGTNILLQEFIKESAGTDIRAFVVGNRVVASMQRTSLDISIENPAEIKLEKAGGGVAVTLTEAKTVKRITDVVCQIPLQAAENSGADWTYRITWLDESGNVITTVTLAGAQIAWEGNSYNLGVGVDLSVVTDVLETIPGLNK